MLLFLVGINLSDWSNKWLDYTIKISVKKIELFLLLDYLL